MKTVRLFAKNSNGTLVECGFDASNLNLSNYVTLDGTQIISGSKTFSSTIVSTNATAAMWRNDSSGILRITAGTNITPTTGAMLTLGGSTNTDIPGYFRLFATDGTSTKKLEGKPDGTLTWNSTNISLEGHTHSNYLTKLTNVSEMGRYIDMHYDNATAAYDYDVRLFVNSQGTAAGGGELKITASKVTAGTFNGALTGNVTGNCSGSSGSCTGNAATATKLATARSLYVALGTAYNSSSPVTFDGSATKALPVNGTLAVANGGTGKTTRLEAIKALTNEDVGTNATHFLGLKSDWSKVGYFTLAEAKTLLGLGTAAYTASTAYASASHTHSYLPLTGGTITGPLNIYTDTAYALNTATSLLAVRYKNAAGAVNYGCSVLDVIGTDGTDGYNVPVSIGSANGTTQIGAGESRKSFLYTRGLYNNESLYLTADGSVNIYTNCANDNATYAGPITFTGTASASGGRISITGVDKINANNLELNGASSNGGYIDFHFNNSTADYTSRIIESTSGAVSLIGRGIIQTNSMGSSSTPGLLFTGTGTSYFLNAVNTNVTKGTAPSSNQYWGVNCYGTDYDNYNKRIAMFEGTLTSANLSGAAIRAYNCTTNTSISHCSFECHIDNTGASYFTATGGGFTGSAIKNNTAAGALGWTSATGTMLPTLNTLAYWNGCYSGTSSNLAYCNKGAFGTIVTKATGDYAASGHTHSYLPLSGGTVTGNITRSGNGGFYIDNSSGGAHKCSFQSNSSGNMGIYDNTMGVSSAGNWLLKSDSMGNTYIYCQVYMNENETNGAPNVRLTSYDNSGTGRSVLWGQGTAVTIALWPGWNKQCALGGASNLWKQLYANTTTISTSDRREKSNISNISSDILDIWENVEWKQFQFNDSIVEKGDNARLHTGIIAQDVEDLYKDKNLDIRKYGFFCYDSWNAKPARYDNETGEVIDEAREAGDAYSVRYEEALCMEAAYQRRKNKQLEDRITTLEKENQLLKDRLDLLESKLNQLLNS